MAEPTLHYLVPCLCAVVSIFVNNPEGTGQAPELLISQYAVPPKVVDENYDPSRIFM